MSKIMKNTILSIAPVLRHVRYNYIKALACSYIDPEYVFCFVKAGKGRYVIDSKEYLVEAGDMVLLPPYKQHIVCSSPGETMEECVIHFDLFCGKAARRPGLTFAEFVRREDDPETALADVFNFRRQSPPAVQSQCFRHYDFLRRELNSDDPEEIKTLRQRSAILEIIALFLSQSDQVASGKVQPRNWLNIEQAIGYIHRHYRRPLPLAEISGEAGISKTYFCLLFRQYTGTTIHRFVTELRLEKARQLMADPGLKLARIAEETGLGSIHNLCKLFQKHYGETPGEFRGQVSAGLKLR